ncbi:MAG: hypothetical protein WAV18_02365, partial [Roseiarcus sp.]
MTIDRGREARRIACGARRLVGFGGMAVLALIVDPVAMIAFGLVGRISRAVVSADASVIAMGRGFIIARADAAGLPRRLYAGGAWLVRVQVQVTRAASGVHSAIMMRNRRRNCRKLILERDDFDLLERQESRMSSERRLSRF